MITFKECTKSGYPARTIENIMGSDVTIAFATDFNSAGERYGGATFSGGDDI